MAQTNVNIRMDEELKSQMEATCRMLGMNMTTAFTIFALKMTREMRIPFEVSVDPFYSDANLAALIESKKQLEAGRVITKSLAELEEMTNG